MIIRSDTSSFEKNKLVKSVEENNNIDTEKKKEIIDVVTKTNICEDIIEMIENITFNGVVDIGDIPIIIVTILKIYSKYFRYQDYPDDIFVTIQYIFELMLQLISNMPNRQCTILKKTLEGYVHLLSFNPNHLQKNYLFCCKRRAK